MSQALDGQLSDLLRTYTADVQDAIESALTDIGKDAVQQLKADSPKRTGKYARGWRSSVSKKNGSIEVTVYESAKQAALTHLLENGHRTRNGRMVSGQPHIEPVQNWAETAAQKAIEKAVNGR